MKSKETQLEIENPDKCIQIINEVMVHASTNTVSQFILYIFFIDAWKLWLGNKGFYGFLILIFFWVKNFVSASLVFSAECKCAVEQTQTVTCMAPTMTHIRSNSNFHVSIISQTTFNMKGIALANQTQNCLPYVIGGYELQA